MENLDKKVYLAAYYQANKEKIKVRSTARYEANKSEILEQTKEYRKRTLAQKRISNRKWRENNLEKARKSAREYNARNLDKHREIERKRRALKANGDVSSYTEQQVLEVFGSNCHVCGLPIDLTAERRVGRDGWESGLHMDHVIPIINGGPDALENVRPSHGMCNIRKGGKQ